MNNHDPETTPLPAPVPGLGTAPGAGEDLPAAAAVARGPEAHADAPVAAPRSMRTTQPGIGGIQPQAEATASPAPSAAPSHAGDPAGSAQPSFSPLPGVRVPEKLAPAPLPGVRLRAPAAAEPEPASPPLPTTPPPSSQSMSRLLAGTASPIILAPLPVPHSGRHGLSQSPGGPAPSPSPSPSGDAPLPDPGLHQPGHVGGQAPQSTGSRRLWLVIGGIGAIAVASAIAAVLLPSKPDRVATGPVPTRPPVETPDRPPTSVPVVSVVPVVPVEPPATPPSGPAVTGETPGKEPATPGEPSEARHTGSKPAETRPDRPKVAARPAQPPPGPRDKKPPGDKPDKPGNSGDKPDKGDAKGDGKGKLAAKPAEPAVSLQPVPTLTPALQRQVMVAAESKWKPCAQDAFGSMLTISIAVEPSGGVQNVNILGTLGSTSTGRCVTDQIRKLRFPPFTEAAPKKFVWSYQVPQAGGK